jgi:hypothetical protein
MLISNTYRELNEALHRDKPGYGTSGAKWALSVFSLIRRHEFKVALDYGCGKGTLKRELARLGAPPSCTILEYDPAIEGKTEKPAAAELVVCGDVLEHIEPEFLNDVLDDIAGIALKMVFLVVATRPAQKFLADGRNAHLIVKDADWWVPHLMARWNMREFKDVGGEFVFIGMPK